MQTRSPRSTPILTSLLTLAAACGGGDNPPPPADAAPDIGFTKPTAALKANMGATEVGPADFTCLGTATGDQPTAAAVTLTTTVRDFQNNSIVPNAVVTAYRGNDPAQIFDMKMAGADGKVTLMIPAGVKRFNFKMTDGSSLDTLLLNQILDPNLATQTISSIQTVSKTTAATLPALIGKTRTMGTGVIAGAMRDCQDRLVSNFIATVSSTQTTVAHVRGADTYYFDPVNPLPVRHNQRGAASSNGLFMVIEIEPAQFSFVQIWGYPTDADVAADRLTLIAELGTPIVPDTVITGSYEPLRTGQ